MTDRQAKQRYFILAIIFSIIAIAFIIVWVVIDSLGEYIIIEDRSISANKTFMRLIDEARMFGGGK